MNRAHNSGNILFIILIAVALFAALSYVVISSSRSGGGNIEQEQSQLTINGMMQYGVALRTAITRLLVGANCTEETLSFASTGWSNPWLYANLATPASSVCKIFSPKGGDVPWQRPPEGASNSGSLEYIISPGVAVKDIGTIANEIVLLARVPKPLCLMINKKLKIDNPGGNPPKKSVHALGPPPANFMAFGYGSQNGLSNYAFALAIEIGDAATWVGLKGRSEGCFMDEGRNLFYFYEVLLER